MRRRSEPMLMLRALAGFHDLATLLDGLRLGRFQLADLAADWLTDGAFTRYRNRVAQLEAASADRLPTTGCAWDGPWPVGALPVTVSYGDGSPIFLGYLHAPDPQTRQRDIADFWRSIAELLDPTGNDR